MHETAQPQVFSCSCALYSVPSSAMQCRLPEGSQKMQNNHATLAMDCYLVQANWILAIDQNISQTIQTRLHQYYCSSNIR